MKKLPFEKTPRDVERKGMREGSKAEKALDKKQGQKLACGGKVKGKK